MKASEVIKHELPKLTAELETKGYLVKTFEKSGQINGTDCYAQRAGIFCVLEVA